MKNYEKELELQNEELRQLLAKAEKDADKLPIKDEVYGKALQEAWETIRSLVYELHGSSIALSKVAKDYEIPFESIVDYMYQDSKECEKISTKYIKHFLENEINETILDKTLEHDKIYQEYTRKLRSLSNNGNI